MVEKVIVATLGYTVIGVISTTFYAYYFSWGVVSELVGNPIRITVNSMLWDMRVFFIMGLILSGIYGYLHTRGFRSPIRYVLLAGVMYWFMFDSVTSYRSDVLTSLQYWSVMATLSIITSAIYALILHRLFNRK